MAQSSQSLSVSPTLFDMSAEPGKLWSSSLRVINANPYELTVYVSVVNFSPQGESGQGQFIPVDSSGEGTTLAEWINIGQPTVTIAPEQSATIPFTIAVPDEAVPGGHFAAVLVGTQPPELDTAGSQVETSQIVTSLVFLRVAGEIIEQGQIRSFRSVERILERPQATFELRFQNTGNVHLQPQGEIKITNMWGQERGIIPINQRSMFGNVLPDSIRRYQYSWTGDWSFADIGRYTASVTLAYGDAQRQFASSEYSFWVIPWKLVLSIVVGFTIFVYVMISAIKAYVRRMLTLAGVAPGEHRVHVPRHHSSQNVSVTAPIEESMLDLRQQMQEADSFSARFSTMFRFVFSYRTFFLVLLLLIGFIVFVTWYINTASVAERGYQVTIEGPSGVGQTLSSDEIEYRALKPSILDTRSTTSEDLPPLRIVNSSGVSGLGAKARLILEEQGYLVDSLETELDSKDINTVIVYAPEYAQAALRLSRYLPGALLSAYQDAAETEYPVTVFVGQSLQNEL